ncbi:hypothetical protein, partial [Burkholderia sp. LMG 13014]|uniref:hypothetical protein n=1 Tax=Burkholderia sp. LMG 13014 TaxID=2709306 RepID=UPI00196687DD
SSASSVGRRRSEGGCGDGEEAARLADIETDSLGNTERRQPRQTPQQRQSIATRRDSHDIGDPERAAPDAPAPARPIVREPTAYAQRTAAQTMQI